MTFADALTLISTVLPLLIPVGMVLYKRLLESMPQARRDALYEVTGTIVKGVEQGFAGQDGPTKKTEAVTAATTIFKSLGLKVDPTLISILIEAAVSEMNAINATQHETPNPPDMPANVLGFNPPTQVEVPALRRAA